jgi:hypothetical protein
MSLLDHFHPPLAMQRHWEGFHSKWASAIVDQLNEQLPPRYFAEPHVHRGSQIEVDVATFQEPTEQTTDSAATTTLVWSPARPTISLPVRAADLDAFEVRIMNDEAGPQLVAAVELVSPANKDRAESRNAFSVKCASYLQQMISLIVVDIVTTRTAQLHDELLTILCREDDGRCGSRDLYAAAYRMRAAPADHQLDVWYQDLSIGGTLPVLPLWLNAWVAVPVDLSASYAATCRTLRIDVD